MPVIAAIDPGLLIYLVFVVIWAISRIAQQKKRKQLREQAPPVQPREQRRPPVISDDLREMLETITGQKLDVPQAPPPPPPIPAPEHRRKPQQERPKRQSAPARAATVQARADNRALEDRAPAVVSVLSRPSTTMSTASMPSAGLAFRASIIGSSKNMTPPDWAPNLRQKEALRTAVLNQVILGPPKALER